MRRKTVKSEAQKKKEAAVRAARELAKTKLRYGLDRRQPTEGITPDPLATRTFVRRPKNSPDLGPHSRLSGHDRPFELAQMEARRRRKIIHYSRD